MKIAITLRAVAASIIAAAGCIHTATAATSTTPLTLSPIPFPTTSGKVNDGTNQVMELGLSTHVEAYNLTGTGATFPQAVYERWRDIYPSVAATSRHVTVVMDYIPTGR
ncbi:hypothetical protein HK102_011760 [Quaeritorhiza haematococci]|nr:hypothetical protein HK102_011760 [Quaeritorhiza haematococci]